MNRICIVLCSVVWAFSAWSQPPSYPARAVRIIVPYPPGGNSDLMARLMADEFGKLWDKSVVVENRPGAGGTLGTGYAVKQAPDGYTLHMAGLATHATAPSVYSQLTYDPIRDVAYIAPLALTPNVLLVNPTLPVKSVKDLIAYTRENPGKLNYSSPGVGISDHLTMELLLQEAGVGAVHVPYKGSAEARAALMAGDVHMTFALLSAAIGQARSGALRPLGVSSRQRSPMLPEVPTIAEAGIPTVVAYTWTGLAAPAGTPPEIIAKIHQDVATILKQPDVRSRLTAVGSEIVMMSSGEFQEFARFEARRWGDLARRVGVKMD